MTARARRPWWKRKRWAAALAVWTVVVYPLGYGPAGYAVARGWLPMGPVQLFFLPATAAVDAGPAILRDPLARFDSWCQRLGERHAAAD